VAELVYATDLKSVGLRPCGFESHQSYHLKQKFLIIYGDIMTALTSFVLIGTIVSHDSLLSTVEFNLNPATNGGPSIGILQNSAIPCEVRVGKKIYVTKDENMEHAVITCEAEKNEK
tara:strand:- start:710 stop:1060 length:351 start_codon:yes stop_codon:yes gene_type:complete